jgi:endonuclease/exonuclease/phosphatase family metal-dependent hydrolase
MRHNAPMVRQIATTLNTALPRLANGLPAMAKTVCREFGMHVAEHGLVSARAPRFATPMCPSIRLVTYNIHSCQGTDGRLDVGRVAEVLTELKADVIALQEVEQAGATSAPSSQLSILARELEMEAHFTKTRPQGDDHFGIATLVRHPFEVRAEGTLRSLRGEPRAAQWLAIRAGATVIDLVNTHLSVNFFERFRQLRELYKHPEKDPPPAGAFPRLPNSDQLVFAGDFNAGYLSPEYRYLSRRLRNAQRCVRRLIKPTFPAQFPILRLDHVWVGRAWTVKAATVVNSVQARRASDHLPLLVDLEPKARFSAARQPTIATPSAVSGTHSNTEDRHHHAPYRKTRA